MGYPMTYKRVVNRNKLTGDYTKLPDGTELDKPSYSYKRDPEVDIRRQVAGDLRRLEMDARDANHLAMYASLSGATIEQVDKILAAFFERQ